MSSNSTTKTSVKSLSKQLSEVSKTAKGMGIDTSKADAMVKQTNRQGSKSFSGSKEEKTYNSNSGGSSVPVTTPEPESTGTRYSRITGTPIATNDKEKAARDVLYNVDPFDENKARKDAIKRAGSSINAIEDIYENEKQDALKAGQRDMARTNTISAMTGMMGGPNATTEMGKSDRRTTENVNRVNDRKALALTSIYDKIDQNIAREKEIAMSTQRDNAKRVLDEVAIEATNALNGFAAQGLSWDDIAASDPDTLNALVRQTGKDAFSLRKIYEEALPPDKKPRTIFEGWKGDNFITIRQNADGTTMTETLDAKELGIPEEFKDPSSITLGGNVYWYDAAKPLGEDGRPNLILVGAKDVPESTPQDVPTFDEYVEQLSADKKQDFDPNYIENTLRPQYEQEYGTSSTATTGKLTPTQKGEITRANLTGTDATTQNFFLATTPAFRQYYTRGVSTGDISDDPITAYDKWVEEQKKKTTSNGSTMTQEEAMKWLGE